MTSDVVQVLIKSDAWGTGLILDQCEKLSRDQLHQRFDIGLGSLHDTLAHVISTMRRWTDRLAGRTPRPVLLAIPDLPHLGGETRDIPVAEMRTLLADAEKDLLAVAASLKDLSKPVVVQWPGPDGKPQTYTFTSGAILAHVTTHGYHHRAQCLNMLRRLGAPVPGVAPGTPEPSAVDWQTAVEGMTGGR
jgi:uncharacterized damage-inducible protein DinB